MDALETLRAKLVGLSGSQSPGDARAVARLASDLCEHVGNLTNELENLKVELSNAQKDIARLREGKH